MSTIVSSKKVKARKQHTCDWCEQKIQKGVVYTNSFIVADDCYTWKNHIHCEEIASHLKMFDECDEGVTTDLFQECIREEYIRLMDLYESEVYNYEFFQYPSFEDQLKYVCNFHKIQFKID